MEISRVLVEEHHQRLREAAQAPAAPLVAKLWAIVRRRRKPETPWALAS